MEFRILQKRLLFLHHVATLPEDSLAREVFQVQEDLNLPGLLQDCQEFLVKNGISNFFKYSKTQWKTLVKAEILKLNKARVLQKMIGYKKINYEKHLNEPYQLQPYLKNLNIADARLRYKLKTHMTPTIMMNFPSDIKFSEQLWTCTGCGNGSDKADGQAGDRRDTQTHIMICPGYADLRMDKNLEGYKDLVRYFSQVIKKEWFWA